VSLQITCDNRLIELVGKTFEVVAYQPHWIHDRKKSWEDFMRLDQRQSYSIVQQVNMNWGDGKIQSGWNAGTGWGTGEGWLDKDNNGGDGNND